MQLARHPRRVGQLAGCAAARRREGWKARTQRRRRYTARRAARCRDSAPDRCRAERDWGRRRNQWWSPKERSTSSGPRIPFLRPPWLQIGIASRPRLLHQKHQARGIKWRRGRSLRPQKRAGCRPARERILPRGPNGARLEWRAVPSESPRDPRRARSRSARNRPS